jgi:hypothetical protein
MKKEAKEIKVDIELSGKTYKQLCWLAKKYNVSLNEMVLLVIEEYLKEKE